MYRYIFVAKDGSVYSTLDDPDFYALDNYPGVVVRVRLSVSEPEIAKWNGSTWVKQYYGE